VAGGWFCLLYLASSLYHVVTVILYQYYQHEVGMEKLPDGFHKMGRLYLEPFRTRRGRDWSVFAYDISELQLLILPFSVKMMKHSIHLVSEQFGYCSSRELQSELKYMRSQLTPHFIFNILNAVSVEIKYSPKKAADVLFKAADMIRFSIYDIEKEFISLEKELHYVEQYVELESMRTSQRSEICFVKKGQISITHQVPTLFLVTLVENAFKHSVHATHERSQISIMSQIKGGWLIFEVTNSKPSLMTEKKSEEQKGIGLTNLKKTLALKFGKDHLLDIAESDKSFSVLLRLPLSSKNAPLG
jgi:LytS/YehU family sensor histidine kinase